MHEWGDRVPNGSRFMPLYATLIFDLAASTPSVTAVMTNAVLEGGDPFALTVRSSSWSKLPDGTPRFMGDYLGEIYPEGTQYLFEWRFSTSTNGEVVWNGTIGWAGGHAWYVTISNLTIAPVPWLTIAREGAGSVRFTWATNFADHVLESTPGLPALNWISVTNSVTSAGDFFSVTLDLGPFNQFYRLRKR